MGDEKSGDDEEGNNPPPINGVEYPEKPMSDVSAMKMMQYMEQVDRYWQARGFQELHEEDEEEDD